MKNNLFVCFKISELCIYRESVVELNLDFINCVNDNVLFVAIGGRSYNQYVSKYSPISFSLFVFASTNAIIVLHLKMYYFCIQVLKECGIKYLFFMQ